ncbi:MAG: OadG family protein [Oscillospiraceae bacterium]|nr:OadG family protein [Oscillospiraceae bacterium]
MEMQMDWSYVGAVVITGLVIVFVALILLIAAVWIMGKFFGAIKPKNVSEPVKETEPQPKIEAAEPVAAAVPLPEEDDTEIIAVIAAAVAAMSEECGTPLKIRSIRRTGNTPAVRTNAWARAAAGENTRVF